ncbi:DHA1 family bicyclomycin/chloramphenicol resistance-like MFS transporter [Micromonospora kangleipakensis]|uniref:DHA1 family bicyclomycin/chloramphenicol resistance-like MFS transporter n=2 Tax=Micromonospora kangleipakensis TaxID=1077942 RepID=A0A4Q8BJ66_9ACTN|nr:DHA1 family bicyclomycin/chloramphenicol resistance-like MFS transporter [Micromonospora kangleipakensis]
MSDAVTTDGAEPVLPGDLMTGRQRAWLVLMLGAFIAIGPLTVDMYLPALPAVTAALATTPTAVQLTLTGTLLGLAVGQLFVGPLSDAAGRRRPLLAGLVLHVAASILCVFAPTIAVLDVLRVLQGLGVAAATVIATAVVRDLFSGSAFARIFSRLMLVTGAAPILAPTLGSAVLRWTDWQGVFVTLTVLGVLLIAVALFGLPETLPPRRRHRGGAAATVHWYRRLFRDRAFVALVLVVGLYSAAQFAYVAGSSFVLQQQYGLDEQEFGLVFAASVAGLIGAIQFNVLLLRRYTPLQILRAALIAGTAGGFIVLFFAVTGLGGLATLLVSLFLVLAAIGLAFPNAPTLAMTRHGEAAGTAAALLGAVQFGGGALGAPLVGVLGGSSVAMALVVAGGMTAATAVMLLVAPRVGLAGAEPGS